MNEQIRFYVTGPWRLNFVISTLTVILHRRAIRKNSTPNLPRLAADPNILTCTTQEELSALSSENNALRSKMARLHEENAALKSEVDRLSNPVKNA